MSEEKRGGGPKTDEGESIEEYEEMRSGWLDELEPEGYQLKTLVDVMIHNHWLLMRPQRRLQETEMAIAGEDDPNPAEWTAAQEHKIELMQRYKTTAERAFFKSWNTVQNLRKDMLRDKLKMAEMSSKIEDLEAKLGKVEKEL
ncbi:MAG: hypothetical protein M3Y72_12030 [Acidobacteriota bacterium]|nr:hypothetical protein [Acidobacteriota bacterium]